MKRLISIISLLLLCAVANAQFFWRSMMDVPDSLKGKVLMMSTTIADHITHEAVTTARCQLLAADSTFVDSVRVDKWSDDQWKVCMVTFLIKKPGKYLLMCEADGYTTRYVPVEVKKIYKREVQQEMKTVYMRKLPRKTEIELDEIVVKATKLKFYMNGDTLTYDADAFNLADGSMLDGLIKKLPGVTMEKGGVIKVNGRKIDALLLNGKDFFDSDRELMLENMPAYMVKNVQAYDRTPRDVAGTARAKTAEKEFVMNVKLKKDYQSGWIANANLGGGLPLRDAKGDASEKRFLARAFALRFSNTSRLTLYANANNLNDNRQPGEDSQWTPSQQARGLQSTYMGGANYNYSKGENLDYNASVNANYSETNNAQTTNSATYLEGGDTYSKSMNADRSYDFSVGTHHSLNYWGRSATLWHYFKSVNFRLDPNFNYRRFNRNSNSASVALADDVALQLGKDWLDSVKVQNAGELLRKYAINRSLTTAKGDGHSTSADISMNTGFSPAHNDFLQFGLNAGYSFSDNADRDYNHYRLDYPRTSGTMPTDFRNRYNDNFSRSHNAHAGASLSASLDHDMRNNLQLSYSYSYLDSESNRSLYLLNRLDSWRDPEAHPLGHLPSHDAMLQALDRDNTSMSATVNSTHDIRVGYDHRLISDSTGVMAFFNVGISLPFQHEQLDHHQRGVDTLLVRNTFLPSPSVSFHWNNYKKSSNMYVSYNMNMSAPGMSNLLNIRNDANPLYVTLGNPNLKNSIRHSFNFKLSSKWRKLLYNVGSFATIMQNSVASSLIFDKQTGVSTVTPQNINGTWNASVNGGVDVTLGKFTIRDNADYHHTHSVDLSGTDIALGAIRSVVNNNNVNDHLELVYEPTDKMEFALDGKVAYQHSTSERQGFQTIRACDFNYGFRAQVELPLNIKLSTDLTMYSRRGYSDPDMNTNELVWNARLTKRILHGNLLVQLDGFDILGNLSNVQRTVNAQGRTETFYNVIPSYCLLHVAWKLNKKPKKQAVE